MRTMSEAQELAREIGELSERRYNRSFWTALVIKLLIVFGSLVAGIAHFVTEDHIPSGWHFAGIFSSVLVALSAVILITSEQNSAKEMET
jgi:hypothetical protein